MQDTLHTARVTLVPVTPDDVDVLWALWSDADVRRYLWDDRVIAREEAAATVAECCALAAQGLGLWLVLATAPEGGESQAAATPLGCAGLLPATSAAAFDPRLTGMIEPLVALTPSAWGRGYALEALMALMQHAARTLGLRQLAGVTDVPNAASDRMLRRAGFVVLGEVPGPRYRLRTYLWSAAHEAASTVAT